MLRFYVIALIFNLVSNMNSQWTEIEPSGTANVMAKLGMPFILLLLWYDSIYIIDLEIKCIKILK